jgi:general secretion pathway protein K
MNRRRAGSAPMPGGRRGFALLIVLWTLVLLALIVTHLTATSRSEARITGNFVANATAEATADGAAYEAVFHLTEGSWAADGTSYKLEEPDGVAVVRADSEAGKVNPNVATPDLLASLMRVLGVPAPRAETLAEAIADWREPGIQPRPNGAKQAQYIAAGLTYGPPGTPFENLDEIGRVLGMTPDVLALLRPHLSIYQLAQPDPRFADAAVIQAMQQLPGQQGQAFNQPQPQLAPGQVPSLQTVVVTAEVKTRTNGYFLRRATIRIGAAFPRGFQILAWEAPGREPPAPAGAGTR